PDSRVRSPGALPAVARSGLQRQHSGACLGALWATQIKPRPNVLVSPGFIAGAGIRIHRWLTAARFVSRVDAPFRYNGPASWRRVPARWAVWTFMRQDPSS